MDVPHSLSCVGSYLGLGTAGWIPHNDYRGFSFPCRPRPLMPVATNFSFQRAAIEYLLPEVVTMALIRAAMLARGGP